LEKKLVLYDDSSSIQIAVVIVNSTGEYAISDAAYQILHDWKVGRKDKNNGVVLLAAIKDRRINIQTGYGMEGVLPDILCRRIIDQFIIPAFKTGNYYEGLDNATSKIVEISKGEYKNEQKGGGGDATGLLIFLLIIGVFIFIIIYKNRNNQGMVVTRRGYTNWDGGGWWYMPTNHHNRGGGWYDDNDSGRGGGGFDFGGFGGGDGGGGGASGEW
jgi:uncharacterized protein